MALGFLGLPWESTVLRYDDEATPIQLTGKKMLPIARIDGEAMNESLDIIKRLDPQNKLQHQRAGELDATLNELGSLVHSLAMPYWVWTPEFDETSRTYFIKKKSTKRGPFTELAKRRTEFEAPILELLKRLEPQLSLYWNSNTLTIQDITLAAHVWGLFVVPEFRFSEKWHDYLMRVKADCKFEYHHDFWEQPWS